MSIATPQNTSLVETLSQGFRAINRRLWVIIIPALLNLYLWYGAQVSFRPLVEDFAALMQRSAAVADEASADVLYEGLRVLGQYDLAQRFDALALLPRLTMYAAPATNTNVLPLPEQVLPALDAERVVYESGSASLAMLLFLVVNALLIPLAAVFFAMVAGAVRGEMTSLGASLRRFGRTTASMLAYAALLLAAVLVIGLPLVMLAAGLTLVSPPLGGFMTLLLITLSFWVNIYIGFTPEAIAVGDLDPLQAVRASFSLVRRNFWSTLLLLLVSFLITVGLGLIWRPLVNSTPGLLVAILASAYIGSGLVAARMVFYRERMNKR